VQNGNAKFLILELPLKIQSIFLLACVAGLFGIHSHAKSMDLNQNGWSISIGGKMMLRSGKNTKGDTDFVKLRKVDMNDTLFVTEFICNGRMDPPDISISIHSGKNPPFTYTLQVLKHFRAYIPIKNLLSNSSSITFIEVYSDYKDPGENISPHILLGVLKID